jgi:hypothetical protein
VPVGGGSFQATYNGSDTYNKSTGDCEPLSADKLNSSSATAIHSGANDTGGTTVVTHAPIGNTVHDSAHITGTVGGGTPTGTVTFSVWMGQTTCPDPAVTAPSFTATVTLNASGNADPALSKVVPVNGLAYQATYNGSTTYNKSTSDCEPLTADKLNSSTVTVVHNATHQVVTSALIGSTVHDKATVTGTTAGGTPTGTVDFTVWLGTTNCTAGTGVTTATSTGNGLNASGIVDPALPETVPMGGLSYKAHYNGSTTYNPSDGACEPLVGAFNALTPGYWKNHLANSNSKGPFYTADCKTVSKLGGSCSTQGPWAIQYLPKSLGNYAVDSIGKAASVFQAMNCSSSTAQNAIGCLAGHLLATKLNLANGSPGFQCILDTVANADKFLSGQTVNGVPGINYIGPGGTYALTAPQRALAISLMTTMNNYNNSSLSC